MTGGTNGSHTPCPCPSRSISQFHATDDEPAHQPLDGIGRMVCLEFIRRVAADEMEDGKVAARVGVEPGVGDTEDAIAVEDELLTFKNVCCDVGARPGRVVVKGVVVARRDTGSPSRIGDRFAHQTNFFLSKR